MTDVHGPADELTPAAEKRHTGCRGHQKIEEQLIREVARDVELGFGMESSGRAP